MSTENSENFSETETAAISATVLRFTQEMQLMIDNDPLSRYVLRQYSISDNDEEYQKLMTREYGIAALIAGNCAGEQLHAALGGKSKVRPQVFEEIVRCIVPMIDGLIPQIASDNIEDISKKLHLALKSGKGFIGFTSKISTTEIIDD